MRLARELMLVTGLAGLFLVQVEGFGYVATTILRRPLAGLTYRLALGLFIYTWVGFWLGTANAIYKPVILAVTAAVPVAAFLLGRRWRDWKAKLISQIKANRWAIGGGLLLLVLTVPLWFRSTVEFDALWYHLTIPKLLLQQHNIRYSGILVSYSLQPTMTFFWYLWPLSLPLPTPLAAIVINFIQAFLLTLVVIKASVVGGKYLKWRPSHQASLPLVLGLIPAATFWYGSGYNDVVGLAYGLLVGLTIFEIVHLGKLSWGQVIHSGLIIMALATIKIHFTIAAALAGILWLTLVWQRWPGSQKLRVRQLIGIGVALFTIFYLPWIVRSVRETGRLLDPIGAPGISQDAYNFAGSKTASYHWRVFIWLRLRDVFYQLMFVQYGVTFAVGMIAGIWKRFRLAAWHLWILGFGGFWVVYFASIVLDWRYLLPGAGLLVLCGFAVLVLLAQQGGWRRYLPYLPIIISLIGGAGFLTTQRAKTGMYVLQHQTYASYVATRYSRQYDFVSIDGPNPPDLTKNEPIFVGGVHNLAYIENPVFEAQTTKAEFIGTHTVTELVQRLKTKGVRYMLIKESFLPFNFFCQALALNNQDECVPQNDNWEVTMHNPGESIWWLRLK